MGFGVWGLGFGVWGLGFSTDVEYRGEARNAVACPEAVSKVTWAALSH